jgi:hypothetical protein
MLAALALIATLAGAQEHHGEQAHGEEPDYRNALGVLLGGTYERYALSPTVSLDLVREGGHWVEAVVFILTIGFDF